MPQVKLRLKLGVQKLKCEKVYHMWKMVCCKVEKVTHRYTVDHRTLMIDQLMITANKLHFTMQAALDATTYS